MGRPSRPTPDSSPPSAAGVILTNVTDASDTASSLLADHTAGHLQKASCGGGAAVRSLLAASSPGAPVLDFDAWQRINAREVEAGEKAGKAREKIVTIEEMLNAAR